MLFHLEGGVALHAPERLKTSVKLETGEVSGRVSPLNLRRLFLVGEKVSVRCSSGIPV